MRHLPLILVLAAVPAAVPAAQGHPVGQSCHFDTAQATLTVPAVVFLEPGRDLAVGSAARQQSTAFITALVPFFQSPARLEISVRPVVSVSHLGDSPDSIRFGLGGPLLLSLGPNGRLRGRQPWAGTAIPALNEALVRAALDRDSAGPLPVDDWVSESTFGPRQIQVGVGAAAPVGTWPLMRTALPILRVDAEVTQDHFAKPEYPRSQQVRGGGARVDLRYLVREDGLADPASIEVLSVTVNARSGAEGGAEAFAASAVQAISKSRFHPARVGECRVRSRVVQRVSFVIG